MSLGWCPCQSMGSGEQLQFSNVEAPAVGMGDQQSDPEFVDSANGHDRLSERSPCINAGDPTLSLPGATSLFCGPGVQQRVINIGADENTSIPYFQDDATANDSLRMRVDGTAWHLHHSAASRRISLEIEGPGCENAPILIAYQRFPQMPGA